MSERHWNSSAYARGLLLLAEEQGPEVDHGDPKGQSLLARDERFEARSLQREAVSVIGLGTL